MPFVRTFVFFLFICSSLFSIDEQYPTSLSEQIDRFFQKTPSLPMYAEAGYSPLGRSPVVDLLLADPLYMPTYAQMVSKLIKDNTQAHSLFALETSLLKAGGIPLASSIEKGILIQPATIPDSFLATFPPDAAYRLYSYWLTFVQIQHEVKSLLQILTEEEKAWIRENYKRYFFGNNAPGQDYDFFTSESIYPLKFFELASRIDLAKLADCGRKLSAIPDDFVQIKETFEAIRLEKDFVWTENGLTFVISQKSGTTQTKEADFFIDLGGSNIIRNNAGGTQGKRPLALHIDLKGNNIYEGNTFVQGSGVLGVGMLFNCGGNNTYKAESYSQGCGFFGSGILVNLKGGNRFVLDFGGQSFATFGAALLWSKEGKNNYLATHGMAQAASSTLGIAYLIENEGENRYVAGFSETGEKTPYGGVAQGGSTGVRHSPWLNNPSFYGGLSLLYLGGGNNYLKTIWLGQGSAYFLGAGIVVSDGDNDVFEADFDSQGQGLHLAAGLVFKKGNNGSFQGGWGSLGVSGDRSVGMFINEGEFNAFEGTGQSIGTSRKPKSLGVFINIGGFNKYTFQKISNGSLQFPQTPKEWSQALFLEMGQGSQFPDQIDEFQRGDAMQWGIPHQSLCAVTKEMKKEELFSQFHSTPHTRFHFDPTEGCSTFFQPLDGTILNVQSLVDELLTANYDRRRHIYETLDLLYFKNRALQMDFSPLFRNLEMVNEDSFNYAALWALRNRDKVDLKAVREAVEKGLLPSPYAQKMAVSLLGTLWTEESIPILRKVMLSDSYEEARYSAALALSLHVSANTIAILNEGIKSNCELVRYAIAKGLQDSTCKESLEIVTQLFEDPSFYVRRAAGMSAISMGYIAGIPIVLETLNFPTLDTEYNYGDNIYSELAHYLKVDFGLDKTAWLAWWNETKQCNYMESFSGPTPDL